MNLIKLIISIQVSLAFLCLLIQLYALVSPKWAIFESRVELGLIEEHGHYGLWSICTSKLIPAEVTEDGHVYNTLADCEPMNTFFKPTHSRAFIAIFSLAHAITLLVYTGLLVMRLVEILMHESNKSNETDLELNQSQAKRFLVILTRFLIAKGTRSQEENVKRQIRIKLYTISVAAASTSLALLSAITPRRPLRESDVFQINNVSATNYRVWRGPAFWAQLITLIMDMLVTSLIAIEVRVLFVLQQRQQITTTCSTSDNEANRLQHQEVIVNPFFGPNDGRASSLDVVRANDSPRHNVPVQHEIQETSMSLQITRPKMVVPSSPSTSNCSPSPSQDNTNHYVNSKEVRQLKKLMLRNQSPPNEAQSAECPLVATSYCNPMFSETDLDGQGTSNC